MKIFSRLLLTFTCLCALISFHVPVHALQTACDEANFLVAVALGGTVTLPEGCTITLKTSPKTGIIINRATALIGMGRGATISGGNDRRLFAVQKAARFEVENTTLTEGNAAPGPNFGGAIHNDGGEVVIRKARFTNNRGADLGGGIFNQGGGRVFITESVFTANFGGALDNAEGEAIIRDSTFSQNEATGGGALSNGGAMTVSSSTFADNVATASFFTSNGGAILNRGQMTINNSTFFGNKAAGGNLDAQGGAFFNVAGSASILQSTFAGNEASGNPNNKSAVRGGAVAALAGTVYIRNTILANNAAPTDPNCSGALLGSGNLEFPAGNCPGLVRKDNPRLQPLADNGGPTQTMALSADSSAANGGDVDVCGVEPVMGLDQRGYQRPAGKPCAIGAFEPGAEPPVEPTQSPTTPAAHSGRGPRGGAAWRLQRGTISTTSSASSLDAQALPGRVWPVRVFRAFPSHSVTVHPLESLAETFSTPLPLLNDDYVYFTRQPGRESPIQG